MPIVSATGYQHTLSDLREHVYACLMQDENKSHFKKERVNLWINLVLDKMRLGGLYTLNVDEFVTTADQEDWTPPSTVWRMSGLTYDVDGSERVLTHVSKDELDRITGGDWDANSGVPDYWADDGEYIHFGVKMPVGKRVKYWYWERAQEITTDAELSGFYKVMLPVIVAGVTAQAMLSDGKMDQYMALKSEFEQMKDEAMRFVADLHPKVTATSDHVGWGDPN